MKKLLVTILFLMSFFANSATFKKITELSTASMTNTATNDLIVLVDTSSGPTTFAMTFDELDKRFYSENLTTEATFNGDVTVATDNVLTVNSTAYIKGYILLVSPDLSCSACSVDNSDNFTCTSTTCP